MEVAAAILASSSWDKMAGDCLAHEKAMKDLAEARVVYAANPSIENEILVHCLTTILTRAEKRLT